jgi:TPR repeat protein
MDKKDGAGAVKFLQRACDLGESSGCTNLGMLYLKGHGAVERDPAAAVTALEKGCEGGSSHACQSLGRIYLMGLVGQTKDPHKAADLVFMACAGSDKEGGESQPESCVLFQQIAMGLAQACDEGNVEACKDTQRRVQMMGVAKVRMTRTAKAGCDAGDESACEYLKALLADEEVEA